MTAEPQVPNVHSGGRRRCWCGRSNIRRAAFMHRRRCVVAAPTRSSGRPLHGASWRRSLRDGEPPVGKTENAFCRSSMRWQSRRSSCYRVAWLHRRGTAMVRSLARHSRPDGRISRSIPISPSNRTARRAFAPTRYGRRSTLPRSSEHWCNGVAVLSVKIGES